MPPRKEPMSEQDLRRVAYDHGIRLEGSVSPNNWPDEHKHHFQVARAIQFLEYETYKADSRVPRKHRSDFQKRVRELRDKVRSLLYDVNPNEPSWRQLEVLVFARLLEPVTCASCTEELILPYFEAHCAIRSNQTILLAERRSRKLCQCKGRHPLRLRNYNGGEHDTMFTDVVETSITHVAGDDLERRRISMRPDRVFGLRTPSTVAPNDIHFPAEGREQLLLPFLVVEAKKERGAPGFRSILFQTAFPVRRFLRAQAEIDSRDSLCEPSLVWFFAYQGDIWRLHAGTLDRDKVRIFDLWQGNVQSHDGALQLLLLVDYIWSWARDIYRPTIKKMIDASTTSFRAVSPISVDRFRYSLSLEPTVSSAPNSQDAAQMDVIDDANEMSPAREDWDLQPSADSTESTREFLRWAAGHKDSPSWTALGCVQQANLVKFEIRYYSDVDDCNPFRAFSTAKDDLPLLEVLYSKGLMMTTSQLNEIGASWTAHNLPTALEWLPTDSHYTTIIFETRCDESTWQISRALHCIIWHSLDVTARGQYHTAKDPGPLIAKLRNIEGIDSVLAALRSKGLILEQQGRHAQLEWHPFTDDELQKHAVNAIRKLGHESKLGRKTLHCIMLHNLSWVTANSLSQIANEASPWDHDVQNNVSMLATRPSAWHRYGPKFCLFVLNGVALKSGRDVNHLLEEAMSMGSCYGDDGYQWSTEDGQIFRRWCKALVADTNSCE